MKTSRFLFIFSILICVFAAVPATALASQTDGTINSSYKYAWSDVSGWMNFGLSSGNVHITDSALTGHVWTANNGWISLNPTNGGVSNNGEGDLSGSAWGEQLGWIDFDGVSINSNGEFSGQADGDTAGNITFDCDYCDVRTDWRPVSGRTTGGGGVVFTGNTGGNDNSGNNTEEISTDKTDDQSVVTELSEADQNDLLPIDIIELIQPKCGDGVCDSIEGCTTCALDCGACVKTPICGDFKCNGGETCATCRVDCGVCIKPAVCGDNKCNGGETCATCSNDCGICEVFEIGDPLLDAVRTVTDEVVAIYEGESDVGGTEKVVIGGEESVSKPPANISDINTQAVYTNSSYESESLSLLLEDKSDCREDNGIKCFKKIYGLEKIEDERPLTDEEVGDAIVFNKRPDEVVEIPRIVNLSGKVGAHPAILVVSKPDDSIVIGLLRKNADGKLLAVMKLQMNVDEEGKGVLTVDSPLSDGQYYAVIYAIRNGVKLNGKGAVFEVDTAIDAEFNIDDFEIVEDPNNVNVDKLELSGFSSFLLSYLEVYMGGKFMTDQYVDFVKGTMKKYIVKGNVNSLEMSDMIVYVTYETVVFGSAVISDASTKGSFNSVVAGKLSKGEHTVTVYAYDPKTKKMTSVKVKKFVKK